MIIWRQFGKLSKTALTNHDPAYMLVFAITYDTHATKYKRD